MKRRKVAVAMSGGVDSSISAYLLCSMGFDVTGITMCLGLPGDRKASENGKCCGPEAVKDARKVCERLGIAHYVLDFSDKMQKYIVADFISEYENARTPNPCVRCNTYLKFGKLLAYIKAMGFDLLATGHYAKIEKIGRKFFLKRHKDRKKDQTYFLYGIRQEALKDIVFPLEDISKKEVRQIARENNMSVAEKKQSQDLCFLKKGGQREFLKNKLDSEVPGDIVDLRGNVLGRHRGLAGFTRGQRKGLNVAIGKPVYVLCLDRKNNTLVVGEEGELFSGRFLTGKVNLLVEQFPERAEAQIRYNARSVPCRVDIKEKEAQVVLDEPERAIARGQSVVFYHEDIVCGGAVIEKV